jgi:hypothetical protein
MLLKVQLAVSYQLVGASLVCLALCCSDWLYASTSFQSGRQACLVAGAHVLVRSIQSRVCQFKILSYFVYALLRGGGGMVAAVHQVLVPPVLHGVP